MSDTHIHIADTANSGKPNPAPHRRGFRQFLRITGIAVASLLILAAGAIFAFMLWVTPQRLSEFVDKEASEYFDADVNTSPIEFSIVSTFPYLHLRIDSIRIDSRCLKGIPAAVRRGLPSDCDFLVSTGRLEGGIDLLALTLRREISLRDVSVDNLRVNLVAVNDSVNNYSILPPSAKEHLKTPIFKTNLIRATSPLLLTYFNLESQSDVTVSIGDVSLRQVQSSDSSYRLCSDGSLTAKIHGVPVVEKLPFRLDGDIAFQFRPFKASMTGYGLTLGDMSGRLDLDIEVSDDTRINRLSYDIRSFDPIRMMTYMPHCREHLHLLKDIRSDIELSAKADIETPYRLSSSQIPSYTVAFNITRGWIEYIPPKGKHYRLSDLSASGAFHYDSKDPSLSRADIHTMSLRGEGMAVNASGSAENIFGTPSIKSTADLHADLDSAGNILHLPDKCKVRGKLNAKADINILLKSLTEGIKQVSLSLTGKGSSLSAACGSSRGAAGDLRFAVRIREHTKNKKAATGNINKKRGRDSHVLDRIPHTPEYLKFKPIGRLSKWLSGFDAELSAGLKDGVLNIESFPADIKIGNMSLHLTPDTLEIEDLKVSCRSTRLQARGEVSNLRRILTETTPIEIPLKLDLRLDTVNINQLASVYEQGLQASRGYDVSQLTPAKQALSASDSVALILPRNLRADIRVSAKETVYTNLRLRNLATRVRLRDGDATVDTLSVSSDFGNAGMKMKYSTSDIRHMEVDASMGILDINIVNFFKNFHSLLEMMPEMKNLTGMLSGRLSGHMNLFPTMYVNVPSLHAEIGVEGWNLRVHQNSFIRRVTKMMLIPESGDINIQDMKVHALVHSNLLELYPFDFNFNKYSLRMGGVNNFNGNMYYHIGVLDSPLHFPFGINIEGQFHHPKLRFGGPHYKPDQAEKITTEIMMENDINVTREMKYYLKQFIHHAAMSDTISR